jgi:RND family efflux transporter MFP subunit
MDDKAELLDRLRIDRSQGPTLASGRRRSLLVLVVVVVLAASGITWRFALAGRAALPVHAATAKGLTGSGDGAAAGGGSVLDASGYVVAMRQATVSAKSIYKVTEMLVQEGQAVKQGQIIARLDDSNVRAALEQSQAQVKQLQAALEQARVAAEDARPVYLRDQKQLAEGLISQEVFDTEKANYDAAQNTVEVAAQNLAVAKAAVEVNRSYEEDTVIRAPFNGVVTVKSAQPGQIVSPQFSGGGGIATLVDMDSLEVDVDVSENFINRVHSGQTATITLNAYPERQIPASVIAIIPTADQTKATVKVRVAFKQKDARVLPQMGARVSFLDDQSESRSGAAPIDPMVLVPPEAVQGEGSSAYVWVIDGGKVARHGVRLGARTSGGQTILSGLEAGALVVTGDASKLADGARVRVVQ